MITIKEYKEAEKENKKISKLEESQDEILGKKSGETREKFWDAERKLREQKYKEEEKNEKEMSVFKEKIKKAREPHYKKMGAFKKVLEFIGISKKEREINPQAYVYDYPRDDRGEVIRTENGYPEKERQCVKPFKVIKDDEFAKIGIFIYENDKPKNKFSLCAIGKTIFNEEIMTIPYSNGLSLRDEGINIRKWIKDMPNKNDLVVYFERNKHRVLKEFLEHHAEVEIEYKEVIKATKTKEWQKAYWESRKDYYENSYSHGEETDEYKNVLKELEKLK